MPRWIHRLTPIVMSLIAISAANAGNTQERPTSIPSIQTRIERVNQITSPDDAESLQRRLTIASRANDIFTLFASELIYSQGKSDIALATDMRMLEHTQEPEVAERAMEMALGSNKIAEAQAIAERWKQIEPNETPARQRLLWELALAKNDFPQVVKNTDAVLSHANDYQLRRLFLKLAQFRLNHLNASDELNTPIHKTAVLHPEMAEAMIADAIYGVTGAHEEQTIKALQALVRLDSDIFPASQLTLNLINIKQPQYLLDFYQQTGVDSMPSKWQSLYIELLIKNNKLQQAYQTLQPLLARSKSADLYLQAAFLAVSQKADTATIASYAEKIAELGNRNQRSKAAIMVAMRYYDEHNLAASRAWVAKADDPQFAFDQALMMCSLEAEEKHWSAAQKWLNKAQASKNPGIFFSATDLLRLQTFVNSSSLTSRQYEQYLNKMLAKAEQGNSKERTENVPPLLLLRGLLYADKLNEPAKAVADMRRFVQMRPDQVDGLNALGYTLLSLPKENWHEAQVLLERAYALSSQSPAVNDSLGWAYYLNGNAQKALPLLEYAYQQQPESEVAAHLGEVYWHLGRESDARRIWSQGWLKPKSDRKILSQILNKHGIKPDSLPLNTAKKEASQSNVDFYLQQASALYSNDERTSAAFIDNINKVMQTGNATQRSEAAYMAASRYFSEKNLPATREWLSKVTENKFATDKAYLMGMLEVEQNNLAAAQQWLQRMNQSKQPLYFEGVFIPQALSIYIDSKTLEPKAYVRKLTQQLEEAQKKAVVTKNNLPVVLILYFRGITYAEKLDQPKKAIKDFRAYTELKPDDAEGYNALGYTMLSMSKRHWAEALTILQHAYQIEPDSYAIQDSLGWAYYLNGDSKKALPLLRTAYGNTKESAIAAHLGEVLWQMGEQEQAKQVWAQGLTYQDSDQKVLQQTLKKFAVNPASLSDKAASEQTEQSK